MRIELMYTALQARARYRVCPGQRPAGTVFDTRWGWGGGASTAARRLELDVASTHVS